jgi:hypothetical protein
MNGRVILELIVKEIRVNLFQLSKMQGVTKRALQF